MTRAQVIRALHAPGIHTDIAWAVKKKRSHSSAMATGAQLALPRSGGRPSASGTSAGSSHIEEPRCQSSDARQEQFRFFYRRKGKVYSRRKFQQPCMREAAGAVVAQTSSILPENDGEVKCDDGQDTSTTVATATPAVEKSEESARSSTSPKAWEGRRSTTRIKRAVPSPPPVLAGVAGVTMREEDGTNGKQPEAQAAAATADVGRPQRRRNPGVSKSFVNSSTRSYEWLTFYPGVPFPEDYEQLDSMEQLGEVETISTGSEGGSSDISDSADKPFSLKLQTEIQKTCKARRILVEDAALFHSVPGQVEPQHVPPAAAANPPTLPKQASSPMCRQIPDKLQESNGECELGNRTSATPSESAAAAAAAATDDDKDGSWTASDVGCTIRFPKERLTLELKISTYTMNFEQMLTLSIE